MEQSHSLPKEDGLWPTCSHNRKLHFSWKEQKAKFPGFDWAGEMFWFSLKQPCSLSAGGCYGGLWEQWVPERLGNVILSDIDWISPGMKAAMSYGLGFCFSETSGWERDSLDISILASQSYSWTLLKVWLEWGWHSLIIWKVERAERKLTAHFHKSWSFQYFLEQEDIKFLWTDCLLCWLWRPEPWPNTRLIKCSHFFTSTFQIKKAMIFFSTQDLRNSGMFSMGNFWVMK